MSSPLSNAHTIQMLNCMALPKNSGSRCATQSEMKKKTRSIEYTYKNAHNLALALRFAHSVANVPLVHTEYVNVADLYMQEPWSLARSPLKNRILVWRFLSKGQRFYCNDSACWSKPNETTTVWRTVSDLITLLMHPIFLSLSRSVCVYLSIEPNSIIKTRSYAVLFCCYCLFFFFCVAFCNRSAPTGL